MGHTVLAHALYSCNQIELDLNNFFSTTGDAHAVSAYNNTNLIAKHLIEFPDNDLVCVLQIKCLDWAEILRIKLSYSKWVNDTPTPQNYKKFNFLYQHNCNIIKLWQEFYQNFKDPTWPDCPTPDDIVYLPEFIQLEIADNYQLADTEIQNYNMFVEWLAITYYDSFFIQPDNTFKSVVALELDDYINNNITPLINVCTTKLKWQWDTARS